MLFNLLVNHLNEETVINTCDRMTDKYGTDDYVDLIHEGFDVSFSKYRREFVKALAMEVISRGLNKK